MHRVFFPRLFVWLVALLFVLLSTPASAGQQEAYTAAFKAFKGLLDSPQKAKRRDLWLGVHARFQETLNMDSDSSLAPRALYYMGRCYEELGKRSFLAKDSGIAIDYFERAANRFDPSHRWVDDCLYRAAVLYADKLGKKQQARTILEELLEQYPRGDKAAAAKKFLAELKKPPAQQARTASTASGAPKVQTTRTSSQTLALYKRTLSSFRTLRQKKNPKRHEFERVHRDFERVYKASPGSTTGARSQYFMGFVYEDLAEYSRSGADYKKAVQHYTKALDIFDRKDSWRDDALLRRARIYSDTPGEQDNAYADLLSITRDYPAGDQVAEAKKLLHLLDQQASKRAGRPAGPSAKEPDTPAGTDQAKKIYLKGIRHRSSKDFTRVVLEVTGRLRYKDHSLPSDSSNKKSPRMFIDLYNTRLDSRLQTKINVTDAHLMRIRAGQNKPSVARVVLDFQQLKKYHIFTLENPYRIVVDVFARENGTQANRAAPKKTRTKTQTATPKATKAQQAARPAKSNTRPVQNTQTAKDVLAQLGMTIQTIMIDPGHGGVDPGALEYVFAKNSKGKRYRQIRTKEKDIVLRQAKILGEKLRKKGYTVLYTRSTDKKIPLEDRALASNLKKADLFISLHCNANKKASIAGFETYYLGKARSDIVLRLAAKENNVDPVKISDSQKIVLDLVHNFKIKESRILAQHVQKNTIRLLRSKYKAVNDHGARPAPFFVLIGAQMPAILVESGYLTNKTEAGRLRTDAYISLVAEGITKGIEAYRTELAQSGF